MFSKKKKDKKKELSVALARDWGKEAVDRSFLQRVMKMLWN